MMKGNESLNEYGYHNNGYDNECCRMCSGQNCIGYGNNEINKRDKANQRNGKDIYINNSPVINICVKGAESGPVVPMQFLSSYMEALGNGQVIPENGNVVFDIESIDSVGGNIELDESGTVFTINRPGLYHVEWNLNLGLNTTSAVVGIIENGEAASGSATVTSGNFSSGTIIQVTEVPFTISLHNYNGAITIEDILPFGDSAASIRIVRFADGATQT